MEFSSHQKNKEDTIVVPPVQDITLIPTTRIVERESPKGKFIILALLGLIDFSENRSTQRI
jgi:hypothetical protein